MLWEDHVKLVEVNNKSPLPPPPNKKEHSPPPKQKQRKQSHRCPFLVVLVEKSTAFPGLPGGLIIYQGNPSICAKRTPMIRAAHLPAPIFFSPKSSEFFFSKGCRGTTAWTRTRCSGPSTPGAWGRGCAAEAPRRRPPCRSFRASLSVFFGLSLCFLFFLFLFCFSLFVFFLVLIIFCRGCRRQSVVCVCP